MKHYHERITALKRRQAREVHQEPDPDRRVDKARRYAEFIDHVYYTCRTPKAPPAPASPRITRHISLPLMRGQEWWQLYADPKELVLCS